MSARVVGTVVNNVQNSLARDGHIATRGKGVGNIAIQPLVHPSRTAPQTPLFLSFKNGSKKEALPHVVESAISVGLSQLIVTGIEDEAGVVALCFKGSSNDGSLSSVLGIHNLDNVPRNSLFFYHDGSGILQAAFGGDPVEIWNRRSSHSFREISFELLNASTGEKISYDGDVLMWLYVHTETWQ